MQNHTRPTLEITADRALVRAAGDSIRYLRVQILAPLCEGHSGRAPAEVAFSVDRSGSMNGDKIELAKQAVNDALAFLSPTDHFSVVTFGESADLLVPRSEASPAARTTARYALAHTQAGGGTALFDGWLSACGNLDTGSPHTIARCLLLTDGLANVGPSAPEVLLHHARELLARGVRTSTFGLGRAFNEELLDSLATAGGGNFYYIENAAQIPDFFSSELGEALETTARNVRLVIHGGGLHCDPITSFDTDRTGEVVSVSLGDLTSGQLLDLVIAVRFPAGAIGSTCSLGLQLYVGPRDPLAFSAPVAETSVRFAYADHADNDRQHRDELVDRVVAQAFASRARKVAVILNRKGDYTGAHRVLHETALKIASYGGRDEVLRELVKALGREASEFSHAVGEGRRKSTYSEATSSLKARTSDGRATRR